MTKPSKRSNSMADPRHKLWLNILEDLGPPEGCILPGWLICVYLILFPLHGLRHLLDKTTGFDFLRLVWRVHGIEISDRMLLLLASAQGQVCRVTTVNGVATLEILASTPEPVVPGNHPTNEDTNGLELPRPAG